MEKLSTDSMLREELIQKGSGNVKRFSWDGIRKQYWSALME